MVRMVLGVLLLMLGAIKVLEGHDSGYSIGKGLFYGMAGFECVLGIMLFTRYAAAGSLGVLLLAAAGMVAAFLGRTQAQSCGCFGSVTPDDWRLHMAISATLGLLGLVAWETRRRRTATTLGEPAVSEA